MPPVRNSTTASGKRRRILLDDGEEADDEISPAIARIIKRRAIGDESGRQSQNRNTRSPRDDPDSADVGSPRSLEMASRKSTFSASDLGIGRPSDGVYGAAIRSTRIAGGSHGRDARQESAHDQLLPDKAGPSRTFDSSLATQAPSYKAMESGRGATDREPFQRASRRKRDRDGLSHENEAEQRLSGLNTLLDRYGHIGATTSPSLGSEPISTDRPATLRNRLGPSTSRANPTTIPAIPSVSRQLRNLSARQTAEHDLLSNAIGERADREGRRNLPTAREAHGGRTSQTTLPGNVGRGRSSRTNLTSRRTTSSHGTELSTPPSQRSGSLPRRSLGVPRSRTNSMALLPGLTRSNSHFGQLRRTGSMGTSLGSIRNALAEAHTNIPSLDPDISATGTEPSAPLRIDPIQHQVTSGHRQETAAEDALAAEMQGMMLATTLRTPSPQIMTDLWSIGKSPYSQHLGLALSSTHSSPSFTSPLWSTGPERRLFPGPRSPVSPSASYSLRSSSSGHIPVRRYKSGPVTGTKQGSQAQIKKRTGQVQVKTDILGLRLPDSRRRPVEKRSSASRAILLPPPTALRNKRAKDEDDRSME